MYVILPAIPWTMPAPIVPMHEIIRHDPQSLQLYKSLDLIQDFPYKSAIPNCTNFDLSDVYSNYTFLLFIYDLDK